MSWHLSNAVLEKWHYSQGRAVESLAGSFWDGKQSAEWRSIPFAPDDSCSAKMKATCHRSPYGMMYLPLTDCLGGDVLTWFLEGFPVKESAAQITLLSDLMIQEADYGKKWHAPFATWHRLSFSWRTPQDLLFSDSGELLETFPRWGIMLDGACYPLPQLVPSIQGSESGFLATPTATHNQTAPSMMKHPGCRAYLPTPTAHNAKEGNYPSESERNTPLLATHAGGKINPEWTEWLMGWPHNWTGLERLETAKFRKWLSSHGKPSPEPDLFA